MNIKQVRTSSCETTYDVGRDSAALSFADYGCIKRFALSDEMRQKWSGWDGLRYFHQNPDNIQGPTFDVLPNGLADIEGFLLEFLPKRKEAVAKAEERNRLRTLGLNLDKETWPKRESEIEPRILGGYKRDDGGFVVKGADIVRSLKKAGKILNIDGCIFATTILRQYASIWRKEAIVVYPPNGENEVKVTVPDCRNRATIRHGARDKYRGLNGYHVRLKLQELRI
jgi:hypothetical protein